MRKSSRDLRQRQSEWWIRLTNLVRRVVFAATAGGRWTVLGYETDEGSEEAVAPVFGGVGCYARPGAGDRAEGILIHVGGSPQHPVVVATRDEDARRRYVAEFGELGAGEVAIFPAGGKARVLLQADGAIVIEAEEGQQVFVRQPGGEAEPLVTLSEFNEHTHSGHGVVPSPLATGTTVLKAQ